ncbi:MAG: hypothetical protein H5T83_05260 [Actinotalea sp.]|nr:hypothetical protein [Actinotalea sp.]
MHDEHTAVSLEAVRDVDEALRWFHAGRSLDWVRQEYERRYNVETTAAMWELFVRLYVARERTARSTVIPWDVREHHQWSAHLAMLRVEEWTRAGHWVTPSDVTRHAAWRQGLEAAGLVVDYDPASDEGFVLVPRRDGVDTDVIRDPSRR